MFVKKLFFGEKFFFKIFMIFRNVKKFFYKIYMTNLLNVIVFCLSKKFNQKKSLYRKNIQENFGT